MTPALYRDALQHLLAAVSPVAIERVPIQDALDRVTAEPVSAPQALPNNRRSAVDGYALKDLHRQRWRVIGTCAAGEVPGHSLADDEALAVMTGGGVPTNAQAVVRVEQTRREENQLVVSDTLTPAENINEPGSELPVGQLLLAANRRIDPIRYSALCYAGLSTLRVYRPLKVGVMMSGPELLPPGAACRPGGSYECHQALLQPLLQRLGCRVTVIGPVDDRMPVVRAAIESLAEEHDLIVTSGGVSMGNYDFVRPLLHEQEFSLVVDRTKIKPGRPLVAARRRGQLFMALPGYPAAFLVNVLLYLLPVIKKMAGCHASTLWRETVTQGALRGRLGRSDFIRIRRTAQGVEPLDSQLTSHFANFTQVDGLAWLDESRDEVRPGEAVPVLWFSECIADGGL